MPLNHTSKYAELTDAQFLLIGKLTVEFSNIEFSLGQILGRLLFTPSFLSLTYTDRMNVNSLIDKVKNAVDIHGTRYGYSFICKELCSELEAVVKEIEGIRIIRNKFAHYCWCREDDNKIFGTSFPSTQPKLNKPNEGIVIITNTEIETMYKSSYAIVNELNKILDKLPEFREDGNLKSKLSFK